MKYLSLAKRAEARMREDAAQVRRHADPVPAPTAQGPASPEPTTGPDSVAAILDTRLDALREPLPVASAILGETLWLCANERQATAIRAKGGTPYTPPEVAILRDLYTAVKPEVWAERLKLIHQAKKEFQGRLEP